MEDAAGQSWQVGLVVILVDGEKILCKVFLVLMTGQAPQGPMQVLLEVLPYSRTLNIFASNKGDPS